MHLAVRPLLIVVVVLFAGVGASPAAAADCVSGTTEWTNPDGGDWGDASNWSNGVPTANCDARITLAGDYDVAVGTVSGSGGVARSLKIGGDSGSQSLVDKNTLCAPGACDPDRVLNVGAGGISINGHGTLEMNYGAVEVAGSVSIGGWLRGDGTLKADGGVVNSSGRVAPRSRNILGSTGTYTQGPDAELRVDWPSRDGQSTGGILSVSGAVKLDGAVVVTAGTPPHAGPLEVVTTGTGITGTFASLHAGGLAFTLSYTKRYVLLGAPGELCTSGTTSWQGGDSGRWWDTASWTNGIPTAECDVVIAQDGIYQMGAPGAVRSLTVGGGRGLQIVDVAGLEVGAGGVTVVANGHLHLEGDLDVAGAVTIKGGRVSGNGTLRAAGGVTNESGSLALERPNREDVVLRIEGSYTQGPGGRLAAYVPSADELLTSRLVVTGRATLDGTLGLNSPFPSQENPYQLISTPGGRTGTFSSVEADPEPYSVSYTDDRIVITSQNPTCRSGSTSWTNPQGGDWRDGRNWSNGTPTLECDAFITLDGTYTVEVGAPAWHNGRVRNLTIGGDSGTQTLHDETDGSCDDSSCPPYTMQVETGVLTVNAHGAVRMTKGYLFTQGVRLNGGSLTGDGQILASSGVVNTGGILRPSSEDAHGRLTISGGYAQDENATLAFDIPAGDSGKLPTELVLLSPDDEKLDGTLSIDAAAPPADGTTRLISTVGRAVGQFSKVTIAGPAYEVNYPGNGVLLASPDPVCTSGVTSWKNPAGGLWADGRNWSNGRPSSACDARITMDGDYTVRLGAATTSGGVAKSLNLGGTSGTQTLRDDNGGTCGPRGDDCNIDHRLRVGEGGITVNGHGVVDMTYGEIEVDGALTLDGGLLQGPGRVRADGGVINHGGTVNPRNEPDLDPALTIEGAYSQDANATIRLYPPPEGFLSGRVQVTGPVTLDGTAETLTQGRAPSDPIAMITSDTSVTGTFARVHYTSLTSDPPLNYRVSYRPDAVVLSRPTETAVPVQLPGPIVQPPVASSVLPPARTEDAAPVLWGLKARPKTFLRATTLGYRSTRAARVMITVAGVSGRLRVLSSVTTRAHPGLNLYRLDARHRRGGLGLSAGRYEITLVGVDAAGHRSKPVSISVRVKRPG